MYHIINVMPKLSISVNPIVIAINSSITELDEGEGIEVCGEIVLAESISTFSASFPLDLIFPEENGVASAGGKQRVMQ